MTAEDRPRLLQTLLGLYAYYDRDLTELATAVWFEDLADHDIGAIESAFVAHRRDPDRGQWLPKSADILRQLRGDANEVRTAAWAGLLSEVRRVGMSGRPNLTAEQRSALDAVGGWGALCRCDERELGHMQRRFCAAFDAYDARSGREIDRLQGPASAAMLALARGALQ